MTESQPKSNSPRRPNPNVVFLVLDVIAIIITILLAMTLLPLRPWFVELFCNFLSLLMFPSILIVIVSIFMRRWRSALLWAIPTIILLVLFGELFLPAHRSRPIVETDSTVHLRVMTCNLMGKSLPDRQSQIDMLRDSGADIIALQEVEQDSVEAINSQLADVYPYRALYPAGVAGTGIISKYPIHDEDFFLLTPGCLFHTMATVDVDGIPVTVISAHPPPPFSISEFQYKSFRYEETSKLIALTSQEQPALILGDFNITDQTSVYRLLIDAGFQDTYREVGWGFGYTWPVRIRAVDWPMPLMRIDFIWHTDNFQAVSAWVGPKTVSDHLPVIADLILNP